MMSMKWPGVMLLGCMLLPMLMCHGKTIFDDLDPNDAGELEYFRRPPQQVLTIYFHMIFLCKKKKNKMIGIVDKRPSFYAGSRYGRSQYIEPDAANNFQVAPRRDYHFLRYGKRSEDIDDNRATIKCYENVRGYVLTCSFTGVQDYYRCWKG